MRLSFLGRLRGDRWRDRGASPQPRSVIVQLTLFCGGVRGMIFCCSRLKGW